MPAVGVVSITTPNRLHREMALAAVAAGKHVWCEKPMALTLAEAEEMAAAAEAAGVVTLVGYNYVRNPAFRHAQRLVAEGAIGRVVHFRGFVDEDYQADPELAWSWRARLEEAGLGALGDLGCHLVSMACGLCGPVESLVADMATVHATRPLADGRGRGRVENEDVASALVRFAGGVTGVIATSRAAWGRKNRLGWEVHGERGMIAFEQERMNELQLFVNEGPAATQGFRTILTGPAHPPYRRLRAGARAPARVQRPQGDRGGRPAAGDRGGRAGVPGLPRGAGVRAGDPRRRPLGAGGGAGGGGGVAGGARVGCAHACNYR